MENYIKQITFFKILLKELEQKIKEYENLFNKLKKIEKEGYLQGNIYKRKIKNKEYLYYYAKIGNKTIHRRLKDDEIARAIKNYQERKKIKEELDRYFLFFSKIIGDFEVNKELLKQLNQLNSLNKNFKTIKKNNKSAD
jgi:hypothetical protein